MPMLSLMDKKDQFVEEFIMDIKVSIKYRRKNLSIEYNQEKIFKTKYKKTITNAKNIQYLAVYSE